MWDGSYDWMGIIYGSDNLYILTINQNSQERRRVMSWVTAWIEEEKIKERAKLNEYKRYCKVMLEHWFFYGDPIENWEWQFMADIFIEGWETGSGWK